MDNNQIIEKKLNVVIALLQNLLALELSKNGVHQGEICKRLHVSKTNVGEMLRGIKKRK